MERFRQRETTIRKRLLIIPLCSVRMLGILIIASISAFLTRESLLDEMQDKGQLTTQLLINEVSNNTKALETVNALIEE